MATYKVIQDIEAEDKLLGPLTLRQFIYAAVVATMGFIAFKLVPVSPLLVLPFLPPMIFFAMLAAPFGHDQPSEVWMLAKIRFFLIPRKRIWNQDGVQELVTITAPKVVEKHYTDGLNQYEVKSRLQALASTLDSRGWAIKNVSVNLFSQPSYLVGSGTASDRLVSPDTLPQEVPNYEVYATDDIMDERSNPTAQHLDNMISQSELAHRQAVVATIQNNGTATTQAGQPPADYWFMNQPNQPPTAPAGYATFSSNPVVFPGMDDSQLPQAAAAPAISADAEKELLERVHHEKDNASQAYGHMKTLQPLSAGGSQAAQAKADDQQAVTTDPQGTDNREPDTSGASANPAILRLANNDDLNVATLAREAKKASPEPLDDEIVISLR
ncbi:MAG TPA: PrgI family protein [Candidatus Limnocylindrales bacterium]|nr:PrgI family protein [Candidatus Limnocylindrales bacterium]